jgi:hypothetical protein
MNWLTWRQYKAQALAGYAALAVIGVFVITTGAHMLHVYNVTGLAQCVALSRECQDLKSAFGDRYTSMQFFAIFALVVPVLIGMFWGAPLVARELESGTHRLAWTQSVSRRRWIVSKLAIVGASTLAFSALLAWGVTWWSRPLTAAIWERFSPGLFDFRGVVPVAYTLFALALGIAMGTLIRKTLPAVFATLAAYAAVRVPVMLWLRPHYLKAKTVTYGIARGPLDLRHRGDWVFHSQTVDSAGRAVSDFAKFDLNYLSQRCPDLIHANVLPAKEDAIRCLGRLGLRTTDVYQPASRYMTFQWIEAGIFIALTALLVVFIIRRVKRVS